MKLKENVELENAHYKYKVTCFLTITVTFMRFEVFIAVKA